MWIWISAARSETQLVYSLGLIIYKNDTVVLKYLDVVDGPAGDFPSTNTGYYIVVSSPSRELFRNNLGVFFMIIIEPPSVLPTDVTSVNVRVPYFPESRFITIYKDDEKIFEIDLSEELCNFNNVCDIGENAVNCPKDCITTTIPQLKKSSSFYLYLITIGVIITLIILLAYKIKITR